MRRNFLLRRVEFDQGKSIHLVRELEFRVCVLRCLVCIFVANLLLGRLFLFAARADTCFLTCA